MMKKSLYRNEAKWLIKIKAVALNRSDLMVIEKNYPGKVSAGFIPCSDAAGEIEAVGEDVSIYTPGDRVLSVFHPRWYTGKPPVTAATESCGNYRDGWLTQYKVIHQKPIAPLPETTFAPLLIKQSGRSSV